jgi:hypothetical protein
MRLKLYGMEVYEVAKKYPPFVLDSKEFPELQLEMEAVAEANFVGDDARTKYALEDLYAKMHATEAKGSVGDTHIMSMVGPFNGTEERIFGGEETMFKLIAVDDATSDS